MYLSYILKLPRRKFRSEWIVQWRTNASISTRVLTKFWEGVGDAHIRLCRRLYIGRECHISRRPTYYLWIRHMRRHLTPITAAHALATRPIINLSTLHLLLRERGRAALVADAATTRRNQIVQFCNKIFRGFDLQGVKIPVFPFNASFSMHDLNTLHVRRRRQILIWFRL